MKREPDCSKCGHAIACIALGRKPKELCMQQGHLYLTWHGCTHDEYIVARTYWTAFGCSTRPPALDTLPECGKKALGRR